MPQRRAGGGFGIEESILIIAKDTNLKKGTYCPDCGHWNIPERKSCEKCESALPKREKHDLKNMITLAALIVSILALLPAALQAYAAYQDTMIAHANLKPLLRAGFYSDDSTKILTLQNLGSGTALITDVQFYRNGNHSREISDIIDSHSAPYFVFSFGSGRISINSGGRVNLAEIALEDLAQEWYNKSQIDEIMNAWTKSINGTTIEVNYEDTLGEKQTLREYLITE